MIPMTIAAPSVLAELKRKMEAREAHIGIVGMGYVGLPLALLFSGERFRVTGFDIAADKVKTLNAGGSYIVRISPAAIHDAQAAGFRATTNYSEIAQIDAVIICVPTPLDQHHEPDLSYVVGTVKSIAPHIHEGQLIVLESTTYPGTTEEVVVPLLENGNLKGIRVARALDEAGVHVAFSPEREDPGNDTVARNDVPKVVGGCGPAAAELAEAMYAAIFHRVVHVSSPSVAEMTKLLENIYRCVNIALVNELKQFCMRMGIDINEVIDAAKTKPFGFQAFYPGPGLGGHCIPIDPSISPGKPGSSTSARASSSWPARSTRPCPTLFSIRSLRAQRTPQVDQGHEDPGPGHRLQARHRRSARVAVTDHYRAAARQRRPRRLQRPLLSHSGPRTPLRPEHDQYFAR